MQRRKVFGGGEMCGFHEIAYEEVRNLSPFNDLVRQTRASEFLD